MQRRISDDHAESAVCDPHRRDRGPAAARGRGFRQPTGVRCQQQPARLVRGARGRDPAPRRSGQCDVPGAAVALHNGGDPGELPGYPAVDILQLDQLLRPDSLTVGALRVYRRRAIAPTSSGNQNAGGVRAVACGPGITAIDCRAQREGPFEWEGLQEGRDFYVDPTGTWFALANRLDQSDYLAVSYITASRLDSIGTFPVDARSDTAVVDTLRLVYDPKPEVSASSPSFRFELRNAYRVGGREIDRTSVALTLSVNQRERGATGDTYLERLGVALANDPTQFDQYNRLFPRIRDPNQGDPVRDLFIVFPHLAPFADSSKLTATERNDSLYRTPRAYLSTQGPPSVFALRLYAAATSSTDRSILSLNSFQIWEGSERIYVGNRLLTRETDYAIDYTTGQVQFTNPDALHQGLAGAGAGAGAGGAQVDR